MASRPLTVATVALPLLCYFVGMFAVALVVAKLSGMDYAQSASVAFTAAGNNFELAIAVAIGTFGATSAQALAGTIGPLIEIPVLVGLVEDLWQRCRAFKLLGADGAGSLDPDHGAWSTQRRLLEAVQARDVEAAVAVTRESLESSQERIRVMLAESPGDPRQPR